MARAAAAKKDAVKLISGANAAISRMGALLESNGGLFMDESRLPLNKAAMKTAFKIAIAAECKTASSNDPATKAI